MAVARSPSTPSALPLSTVRKKKKERKLTGSQRRLIFEMAKHQRAIFIVKHPRRWCDIRYSINSFPMRTLQGTMVATLAREGYLRMDKRGYYVLTVKAQMVASLKESKEQKQ